MTKIPVVSDDVVVLPEEAWTEVINAIRTALSAIEIQLKHDPYADMVSLRKRKAYLKRALEEFDN